MVKRFTTASLILLFLGLLPAAYAGSILTRTDGKGKLVFYNTPSKRSPGFGGDQGLYYSNRSQEFASLVQQISNQYGVNSDLVKAVIQVESNYNPAAVSPKGAMGLMQLMPETALRY